MAFFDKVGEMITSTGSDIANKAKGLAGAASLNSQISACEEMIQKAYTEIGKAYYEANKDSVDPAYADKFKSIEDSQGAIKQLREQLQVIKGVTICPICGAEIASESSFCIACGAKIEKPAAEQPAATAQPEEPVQTTLCPACQAPVAPGSSFCTTCGQKL